MSEEEQHYVRILGMLEKLAGEVRVAANEQGQRTTLIEADIRELRNRMEEISSTLSGSRRGGQPLEERLGRLEDRVAAHSKMGWFIAGQGMVLVFLLLKALLDWRSGS